VKGKNASSKTAVDPRTSAHSIGLRYVADRSSGFHRKNAGSSFQYFDDAGKRIRRAVILRRIQSLAIPPAWSDVWICPFANGHLQAVGRDARGRRQYLYHERWREIRDEAKYDRLSTFAGALPRIRRRVRTHLALAGLPREKVLATVVRLLESILIRIGNEEYARHNHSYGLTTLRDRHVAVAGARVQFRFPGKSRQHHQITLQNRRLAKIVRQSQDLPGQELFQYLDEKGERRQVESGDVNAYLRHISGTDFTAKDFRTWAGTVWVARELKKYPPPGSASRAKKNIVAAIARAAARLGNTPAICKKCYVHPAIVDSYLEGVFGEMPSSGQTRRANASSGGLEGTEGMVLRLLKGWSGKKKITVAELLRRSRREEKQKKRSKKQM
jgi:DNA topoisomerase-1